jgi:hypothetical protein
MKCSIQIPQKRKQVRVACTNCRHSHACCSESRPCDRCNELGLDCVASEIKKRGRKKKTMIEKQPYLKGFISEFCML